MHRVSVRARAALAGLAVVVALAGGTLAAAAGPALAAARGGCDPYLDGNVVPVPCSAATGSGGSSSGGGGSVRSTCGVTPLSRTQAAGLGLAWPPPAGSSWALLACFDGTSRSAPQAGLISTATGAPVVTARQLLDQALGELAVPHLDPATAPPRGTDGLVGLPEWFWLPAAEWHPRTVTVRAGPVWAVVTARPVGLIVDPGAGLAAISCAGPGTAYDAGKPAQPQHTGCSYTYQRPSLGQPGDAYQVSVTVTWRISWTGSGGQGGVLATALALPVSFPLPVAQGEALVSRP